MSHNSKYYTKRLSVRAASECKRLESFGFKKTQTREVDVSKPCESSTTSVSMSSPPPTPSPSPSCSNCSLSSPPPSETVTLSSEKKTERESENEKEALIGSKRLQSVKFRQPRPLCNFRGDEFLDNHRDQDEEMCVNHSLSSDSEEESSKVVLPVPDARLFSSQKYEVKYMWLYYSVMRNGYMCKFCELFGAGSQAEEFSVKGVQLGTHPTRKLERHKNSKKHLTSEERYSLFNTKVNVLHQLQRQELNQKEQNREVIKKLFRCLYFMIRQKWAVCDSFEPFVKFVADLGIHDLQRHLDSNDRVTYLSGKSVMEMIENISDMIETLLLESLRGKKFALLADESTDEANRTQLSIFCRWSSDGKVQDHYLGLINVANTKAEDLLHAIQTFCTAKGIKLTDMRFMGFDGCNTMSGEKKGLQRRMRHVSPFAIYIHCRNHRLALCLKHLTKDYDLLVEVDKTLLALWKLFEYSPKKLCVFKNVQQAYGQKPLNLVKASMTRWLSHLHACTRVLERYETLVDCLDSIYSDSKEPEVYGIRHSLTKHDTIAMIVLLCDVLKPVHYLSLYLQQDQVNFSTLDHKVNDTIGELQKLIEAYESQHFEDLAFSKCQSLYDIVTERTALAKRLRRNNEGVEKTPQNFLVSKGIPFIQSLVREIEDAFPSTPILGAFGYLDPRNLPDPENMNEYGNEAAHTLAEYYSTPKDDAYLGHHTRVEGDLDSILVTENELKAFKQQLFILKERGHLTISSIYSEIEKDDVLKMCFPRAHQLLGYSLLIPASTAVVERGFSLMNDLCTPLRNRLTQKHLDGLMRICREGKETLTNGELEKLVDSFRDSKSRRIAL